MELLTVTVTIWVATLTAHITTVVLCFYLCGVQSCERKHLPAQIPARSPLIYLEFRQALSFVSCLTLAGPLSSIKALHL